MQEGGYNLRLPPFRGSRTSKEHTFLISTFNMATTLANGSFESAAYNKDVAAKTAGKGYATAVSTATAASPAGVSESLGTRAERLVDIIRREQQNQMQQARTKGTPNGAQKVAPVPHGSGVQFRPCCHAHGGGEGKACKEGGRVPPPRHSSTCPPTAQVGCSELRGGAGEGGYYPLARAPAPRHSMCPLVPHVSGTLQCATGRGCIADVIRREQQN